MTLTMLSKLLLLLIAPCCVNTAIYIAVLSENLLYAGTAFIHAPIGV